MYPSFKMFIRDYDLNVSRSEWGPDVINKFERISGCHSCMTTNSDGEYPGLSCPHDGTTVETAAVVYGRFCM